jgi:hypothetical protein
MLGWIYALYMYIKLWNRQRLAKKRLTQNSKQAISTLNIFRSKFESKHLFFMGRLTEFQHWQHAALQTHINNTKSICRTCVESTDFLISNIYEKQSEILKETREFKQKIINLYDYKLNKPVQIINVDDASNKLSLFSEKYALQNNYIIKQIHDTNVLVNELKYYIDYEQDIITNIVNRIEKYKYTEKYEFPKQIMIKV